MDSMKNLIEALDYNAIREILSINPAMANEGIPLDEINTTKAHPLHRICDGVYMKKYSDREAVELAKIFLEYGARIDGFGLIEKKDTPLTAAASLRADEVALLYIESGANLHHGGCHGGTAMHWAAWCGRDKIVKRLVQESIDINKKCIDFKATPLFWSIHGYKYGGEQNRHNQVECASILLQAGADKNIPNLDGTTIIELIGEEDLELKNLFNG